MMKKVALSNKGFTSSELGAELAKVESKLAAEEIAARSNRLTEVPSQVASFSNLRALRLNHNSISSVPSFLCSLSLLSGLDSPTTP